MSAEEMSAEQMAEMVHTLLNDLGYTSERDWFNKRIFLSPNNEAFFSIFQFLLAFADPQMYDEKFKFCLPLCDKRREADFRRILCKFLQDLVKLGELVDVPDIKMALFTTPGRSAFLQVVLGVIEWVAMKKSKELAIIVPPYDATEESVHAALDFFTKQREVDAKLANELRSEMQSQIELLVSDLLETERGVQACREELTKAQEQTKTTEEDEENLRKFSSSLTEIASLSAHLRRLYEIAQCDAPSRDATAILEPLPETLLQAVPEVLPLIDDMNEQISLGKVDIVLYARIFSLVLENRRPLYNDVLEKLAVGSSVDRILEEQRSCLRKAEDTLHRLQKLVEQRTKLITEGVRKEFEAEDGALLVAIDPPSICDLRELVKVSGADFELVGGGSVLSARVDAMPPPPQTKLKRKKIGDLNLKASNTCPADLSGLSLSATPVLASPTIEKLRRDPIRRRSIKEVFLPPATSTPFAKSQ